MNGFKAGPENRKTISPTIAAAAAFLLVISRFGMAARWRVLPAPREARHRRIKRPWPHFSDPFSGSTTRKPDRE